MPELVDALQSVLVKYSLVTATFYTGLGCLLGPSLIFIVIRALV